MSPPQCVKLHLLSDAENVPFKGYALTRAKLLTLWVSIVFSNSMLTSGDRSFISRKARLQCCLEWNFDLILFSGSSRCSVQVKVAPWMVSTLQLTVALRHAKPSTKFSRHALSTQSPQFRLHSASFRVNFPAANSTSIIISTAPSGPALRRQRQGHHWPPLRNQASRVRAKVVFAFRRSQSTHSLVSRCLVLWLTMDVKLGWRDPSHTTTLATNLHPYCPALQHHQLTTATSRRFHWFQEQMFHHQQTEFPCDPLLPSKSFGLGEALPPAKALPLPLARFNWFVQRFCSLCLFVKCSFLALWNQRFS